MKKPIYCSNRRQLSEALGVKDQIQALRDRLSSILDHPILFTRNNIIDEERTPWGGKKIHELFYPDSPSQIIGETWDISGHPLFPSHIAYKSDSSYIEMPLSLLCDLYPQQLGSASPVNHALPYLCKLLNSGSIKDVRDDFSHLLNKYSHLDLSSVVKKNIKIINQTADNYNAQQLHQLFKDLHNCHKIKKQKQGSLFATAVALLDQRLTEKNLSIQLHPYQSVDTENLKKDELWLVIDAELGAGIYLGLKEGVDPGDFIMFAEKKLDVSPLMNFYPVHPFDLICVPSGTLHSLGSGLCVLEIQSSSDTTYRAYDWNRECKGKSRKLHIEELKKHVNPKTNSHTNSTHLIHEDILKKLNSYEINYYKMSPFDSFQAIIHLIPAKQKSTLFKCSSNRLTSFFILEGNVDISTEKSSASKLELSKGDSFICPSSIQAFFINADQKSLIVEIF